MKLDICEESSSNVTSVPRQYASNFVANMPTKTGAVRECLPRGKLNCH